jgi:hypothetical protein
MDRLACVNSGPPIARRLRRAMTENEYTVNNRVLAYDRARCGPGSGRWESGAGASPPSAPGSDAVRSGARAD